MALMTNLKLTAAVKPTHLPAIQIRREKLCKRIWEQMELAKAEQSGSTFAVKRQRSYIDKHTGLRMEVEADKRIKKWWFTNEAGKVCVAVRYGAKVLELAKGKFAVEIANAADLVSTLDVLKNAVDKGELDDAITAASAKLRSGFAK